MSHPKTIKLENVIADMEVRRDLCKTNAQVSREAGDLGAAQEAEDTTADYEMALGVLRGWNTPPESDQ
jgi:hypothetical protein